MRVIAIDGPAGAGKSTIARALAESLGLEYLDTGAMYRAVAFAALRDGTDPSDEEELAALARRMRLEMGAESVVLDGLDISLAIRSHEVNAVVSVVAAASSVRAILRQQQREWIAHRGGGVVEGRDIGTVVFPDALLKVFLTARPEVRAMRRVAQAGGDVEEITRSISERDRLDTNRKDSPLTEAMDALVFDTSDLTVAEVVDRLRGMILEKESRDG